MPLDFVLTEKQWRIICPEFYGQLCASCIIKRASKIEGVINITARVTFAEDYTVPGGKVFQFMKEMEI